MATKIAGLVGTVADRATHTDYKHPRHLRVEREGKVLCMAPSCSTYAALARSLPSYDTDQRQQDADVAEARTNPAKYGLSSNG